MLKKKWQATSLKIAKIATRQGQDTTIFVAKVSLNE